MPDSESDLGGQIFWHHFKIAERLRFKTDDSMWTWTAKFIRFFTVKSNDEERKAEQSFMKFYLNNTSGLCLLYLPVNILLMIAGIIIIVGGPIGISGDQPDPTFRNYTPAVVNTVVWIALSALVLAFFIAWKYRPGPLAKTTVATFCEVWYEIGAAMFFTRLLILVVRVTQALQAGGQCLDAIDLISTGDDTFGYMLIQLMIDTYQAFVMVMLPFPQPWAIAITLTELLRQIIRLESCADRMISHPDQHWILELAILMTVYGYSLMLLTPSIYLESSFRSRFKRIQMQREADQSKREMVGFLSSDVRVPLQYMLHSVSSIDFVAIAGANVQPLLTDIHRYSAIVNDIADELLLLVRIKENRYTTKKTPVPDLRFLLDGTIESFKQRQFARSSANGQRTGSGVESHLDPSIHVGAPNMPLELDEKCLLAAIRQLLVFLTQQLQDKSQDGAENGANASPSDIALFQATRMRPELYLHASVKKGRAGPDSAGRQAGELILRLTGNSNRQDTKPNEEQRVQQATTSYVCATIAAACKGSFATRDDCDFLLTVPCLYDDSDRDQPEAEATIGADAENEIGTGAGAGVGVGSAARSSAAVSAFGDTVDEGSSSQSSSQRSNQHSASAASRHTLDALKHDQALLEDKIKLSANMQARFKRNRVCAIVADSVLENVITGAIRRMRLDDGLTVLHELQRGSYVPVAMLTFVTTYELCVELRQRDYHGLVVLFSGSVSYLDDAQRAIVDYCLPLPCGDTQIIQFIDFLVGVHNDEVARKAAAAADAEAQMDELQRAVEGGHRGLDPKEFGGGIHGGPNEARRERQLSLLSEHMDYLPLIRELGPLPALLAEGTWRVVKFVTAAVASAGVWLKENLYSEHTFLMVAALPTGTMESYTKWKILNPARSWYNHSVEVWWIGFPRFLIGAFVETLWFKTQLSSAVPICCATTLMLMKGPVYRFILKPRGWKLYKYWLILPGIAMTYYLVAIMQQTNHTTITHMTMKEFEEQKILDRNGKQHLFGAIMVGAAQRIYAMFWMHPFNILVILITYIRSCQALWFALRFIASPQMAEFLQLVYTQIGLLNIVYLTHLEHTYRKEFIVTYDHILSRAFFDRCLDICQHDIRKPLEYLLGRRDDLMQVLNRAALSRTFIIDKSLIARLEPLQVSHMLLSEMVHEFSYSHYLLPAVEGAATARQPADALQLGRAVAEIVSTFSSSLPDHHVRIVAELDHHLAVIRVDWRMLSVILTNLVGAALRNIRDDCIENPRNKDLVNTIFLKFVALNPEEKMPFVAPRLMLVNVCDSSARADRIYSREAGPEDPWADAATGNSDSVLDSAEKNMFQYGRSMCARLVQKVSPNPIFHTIYSPDSALKTVQRFTFPYHLSPQTRRAQEHLQAETELPYVTIRSCPSAYLSTYERIIRPAGRTRTNRHGAVVREPGRKHIVLLTCVDPKMRGETLALTGRLESYGWQCVLKYVLKVPSMQSIGVADCVLIDQQLELQERVSIAEIVLKLRVCGFNGVIAVVLQEHSRETEGTKDELMRSAAAVDLVMYYPVNEQKVQSLSSAMEKKCIKQALSMNGN